MKSLKNEIINRIISIEGGYSNDPADSGGETNYGITKGTAMAYGYKGAMSKLPRELAFSIYEDKYWDSVKASLIACLAVSIAEEVVDTAINCGPSRASKFLQRSLNVLNNKEKHYQDIAVDGRIGNITLYALEQYLKVRDEAVLLSMLNVLQGAFYVELAERREKDEKFVYGWLKNRVIV